MSNSFEFSQCEQDYIDQQIAHIISTRQTRRDKVNYCIEGLIDGDDSLRLVARLYIAQCLEDTTKLEDTSYSCRRFTKSTVHQYAPGLFMAYATIFEKIYATGEFKKLKDFRLAADALEFPQRLGRNTVDYLFQWIASRNPGSRAAEIVELYALPTGKMSHNINGNGDFASRSVLFHDSVIEQYLNTILNHQQPPRKQIDAIICLAGTDDWDKTQSILNNS